MYSLCHQEGQTCRHQRVIRPTGLQGNTVDLLHPVGNTDGEDQERHQHRIRVQTKTDQVDQTQLPDHRNHGSHQHRYGTANTPGKHVQQNEGNDERNAEEADNADQTIDQITHLLGETDNVNRLLTQGKFYDLVFKKISLVTTENHLKKSINVIPEYWGILIAYIDNGTVKLRHYRKASSNPHFVKESALLTLWKQEMLNVSNNNNIDLPKKINKRELVSELANNLSLKKVNTEIANSLFDRVTI